MCFVEFISGYLIVSIVLRYDNRGICKIILNVLLGVDFVCEWKLLEIIRVIFRNFGKIDMPTKEMIKRTIDTLPEHFTIEDAIEELIVIDKIEQGLKDVEEGSVYSTEEVKQMLNCHLWR